MVVCVRVRNSLQTNFTFPFFAKQHSPFTRQAKSRLFLVITIFSLLFSLKTCHIASCVLIIFLKALNPSNYPCCCMKLEKCCNYRQTDILESNVKGKIQKTYASTFFSNTIFILHNAWCHFEPNVVSVKKPHPTAFYLSSGDNAQFILLCETRYYTDNHYAITHSWEFEFRRDGVIRQASSI